MREQPAAAPWPAKRRQQPCPPSTSSSHKHRQAPAAATSTGRHQHSRPPQNATCSLAQQTQVGTAPAGSRARQPPEPRPLQSLTCCRRRHLADLTTATNPYTTPPPHRRAPLRAAPRSGQGVAGSGAKRASGHRHRPARARSRRPSRRPARRGSHSCRLRPTTASPKPSPQPPPRHRHHRTAGTLVKESNARILRGRWGELGILKTLIYGFTIFTQR
jgi:hypothetical protein